MRKWNSVSEQASNHEAPSSGSLVETSRALRALLPLAVAPLEITSLTSARFFAIFRYMRRRRSSTAWIIESWVSLARRMHSSARSM